MNEIRDNAMGFDVKYLGGKTGTGKAHQGDYIVSFAIALDDVPPGLFKAHINTMFTMGLVQISDAREIIRNEEEYQRGLAVKAAGIMCADMDFQRWLSEFVGELIASEEECAEALRSILGIGSRADLRTDDKAREQFLALKKEYEES